MKKKLMSIAACTAMASGAFAEDIELGAVNVHGADDTNITTVQRRQILQDTVEKTEMISKKTITQNQAATLTQAIGKQPGVNVETGCSVCGMKRVQLNGLTGNETTVLVDGIPFNSTVSSYYGADAVSTEDIGGIQITRGAGASLIAPEAIGGTINIIPLRPYKNGLTFDVSVGTLGTRSEAVMGQAITADRKTGVLIAATDYQQDQVDGDHNGVSESPAMKNQSISIMMTHRFSAYDSIDIRGAHFTSNVKGGTMVPENQAIAHGNNGNSDFDGGDVNNPYIGDPINMMEVIDTTRDEIYAKEHHVINDRISLQTTLAYAQQQQNSLYEGADYSNTDKTYFGDMKFDHALNDDHFLTYGIDAKVENARSQSYYYYVLNGMPNDDFNYNAYGIYGQDAWSIDDANQLTVALRVEHIMTVWLEAAGGNTIDEWLPVPRVLFRHDHNDHLTSRLSWGLGYRPPLSFFESDHGVLDDGFVMDITSVETSNGANYSLAYNDTALSVVASAAYTQVKNLAYVDDSGSVPVMRNATGTVDVAEADITADYTLTDNLSVTGSYEYYRYNDVYKSLMTLAPVEQRARLSLDYTRAGWDAYADATWVGSRNLAQYGYDGYNVWNGTTASDHKNQTAPAFVTADVKISKQVSRHFSLYAGAKNLFDYTQIAKQSPLFYDANGNFDTTYIWGPLRGRMLYAGLKATF
jgi:outer membrane receptor for ferrienterochelin and colicins